jgi:hypothetical protein
MTNTAQSGARVSTAPADGKEIPPPGRALYVAVRQGFIGKETTLNAWCEAAGFSRGKVQAALYGYSNSDDAKDIRRRAMVAAGLIQADVTPAPSGAPAPEPS